jgi:hypothetical protein
MTTADHHTDLDPPTGQRQRTDYTDRGADTGYDTRPTTEERGGFEEDRARQLDGQDADTTTASDYERHPGQDDDAQQLDAQDADARAVSDPTSTDAAATTPADGDGTPAAATAGGGEQLERLVPAERVSEYSARWDNVKGEFVDEPRQAVAKADALVGELLDELDQLFRKQRSDLERGLDADETSTEDLRLAMRRYRSFFDRLLAL